MASNTLVQIRRSTRELLYRWLLRLPRGGERIVDAIETLPLTRLTKNDVRIQLPEGVSINVRPGSNSLERSLWMRGQYEAGVISTLKALLPHVESFWDVGAHIGYHSLIAARVMTPQAHVTAFEPHPLYFARLTQNIALNHFNNIRALPYGLSDKSENKTFFDQADGFDPAPSLVANQFSSSGAHATLKTASDTMSEDHICPPQVVKIDVEGYEGFVLRGCQRFLQDAQHAPVLIFELNRDFIEKTEDTPEKIVGWLRAQNNYHFALENRLGFKRDALTTIPDSCNVLAWLPGQHTRVEELLS